MSHGVTTAEAPLRSAQMIFQLGAGYIASSALQVALKLTIADRLAPGPRTTAALAAETGVREDALYRVLRLLASVGLFQ